MQQNRIMTLNTNRNPLPQEQLLLWVTGSQANAVTKFCDKSFRRATNGPQRLQRNWLEMIIRREIRVLLDFLSSRHLRGRSRSRGGGNSTKTSDFFHIISFILFL